MSAAPVMEDLMYLENIATSVLVSEKQMSKVHKLMQEAVRFAVIIKPCVWI